MRGDARADTSALLALPSDDTSRVPHQLLDAGIDSKTCSWTLPKAELGARELLHVPQVESGNRSQPANLSIDSSLCRLIVNKEKEHLCTGRCWSFAVPCTPKRLRISSSALSLLH